MVLVQVHVADAVNVNVYVNVYVNPPQVLTARS